jgi:histidinol-phosphate/aromatic aminotransferase/cobyric acid decarboxylase-like protein
MVIRNCGNFRGLNQRFFRVAVRTRNQNNRLIKSLKDILE